MAVKLKDCRIGTLVTEDPDKVLTGKKPRIGHIVAIGINVVGEACPIVEWARRYTPTTSGFDPDTFATTYTGKIEQELMHRSTLDLFTADYFYEARD